MILAGITLFQPDMERLKENIDSIINQVDAVVCIDNGSENISDIKMLLSEYNQIDLVENGENVGIARALNQMFEHAQKTGHEWVLTLDQDSVCPDNLICEYKKHFDIEKLGMLCPLLDDRNYGQEESQSGEIEEVQRCITSAALSPVKVWEAVGGFFEELFIDFVDHDFCAKLQENGYKIVRVNTTHLLHEIGRAQNHNVGGVRLFTTLNHGSFRKYYMARNWYYYIKAHKQVLDTKQEWIKYYFFFLKTFFFEDNKIEKWKAMVKGNKDAKVMCARLRVNNRGE